jgi:outer membrane protein assembly factor BamB
MNRFIAYGGVVVAAAVSLSALGAGGTGASVTASRAGQPAGYAAVTAVKAAAVPGTQLWDRHYNGPGGNYTNGHDDRANSMAVSPSGDKVFVTGESAGKTSHDYATVAYNATTGAQLWATRYTGPGNSDDIAYSVAVSPTGRVVFVTGISSGDYATVAYNATTGAQLWATRYTGTGRGGYGASSVAVSPTGRTVYVTGSSVGVTSGVDYATVAYNATTGAQLWGKRYNGPGNRDDRPESVAVSRGRVLVTGSSAGGATSRDYATVAYNATTGAWLWGKRYNGPGNGDDFARSLAVSPTGGTAFVTGISWKGELSEFATVAYNTATGAQLWVTNNTGSSGGIDANSVTVSPTGDTVFVTGYNSTPNYATVAYNAATGALMWAKSYNGNNYNVAYSVAVSPSGRTVYVTGNSSTPTQAGYGTVAYNAATGAQLWAAHYHGRGHINASASSVAVSRGRVFVTGCTEEGNPAAGQHSWEYSTVAYSG